MWADRLLPGVDVATLCKDKDTISLLQADSIVIDDSINLDWKKIKVYLPDDLSWINIDI